MLTTEIRDRFIAAIKEGTAELEKQQNGTYQIQEVLNELNRVLGLTIVVQDGKLSANGAILFDFAPTNQSFPINAQINGMKSHLPTQNALIDFLCQALKKPEIVKLIREQQNAKQ